MSSSDSLLPRNVRKAQIASRGKKLRTSNTSITKFLCRTDWDTSNEIYFVIFKNREKLGSSSFCKGLYVRGVHISEIQATSDIIDHKINSSNSKIGLFLSSTRLFPTLVLIYIWALYFFSFQYSDLGTWIFQEASKQI